MKRIVFCICLSFASVFCFSQNRDTINYGEIEGVAFDSINNSVLKFATVAIYKVDARNTPVAYTLTNNLGEFSFERLQGDIELRLVVSFAGYKSALKTFKISSSAKRINLGRIYLEINNNILDEVVIKYIPPVRYNKDTLEFNPNAFNLDENAVVEDLMRRLPGVIFWGDGTITVNGREVKSVLVDGRPFFGSSSKVAIQNIPKTAVEKVQVYQQNTNSINQLDSITMVNIKLKKNRNRGSFGKFAIGYGSDRRREVSANLNFFKPGMQVAIIGTHNNVNRIGRDLNSLLESSSLKASDGSFDYQPEFQIAGINKPLQGGFYFQKDLSDIEDPLNMNRLVSKYFYNRNLADINLSTITTIATEADSLISKKATAQDKQANNDHSVDLKYQKKRGGISFETSISYFQENSNSDYLSWDETMNENDEIQSQSSSSVAKKRKFNHLNLNGSFLNINPSISSSKNIKLKYSIEIGNGLNQRDLKNNFVSYTNSNDNQNIDRKYREDREYFNSNINFIAENIISVQTKRTDLFKIDIGSELGISKNIQDNDVKDFNPMSGGYTRFENLSSNVRYSTLKFTPFINLRKTFAKSLSNSFTKVIDINVAIKEHYFRQRNISNKEIQNFNRDYSFVFIEPSIKYTNYQFGRFKRSYDIKYSTNVGFPSSTLIAPLVDSSDVFGINYGNFSIKPYRRYELALALSHVSFERERPITYDLSIRLGHVSNYITDSLKILNSGITTIYPINMDGNKYASSSFRLTRSIKLRKQTVQFVFSNYSELFKRPSILNEVRINSFSLRENADIGIYFYLKSQLNINVGQTFSYYRVQQTQPKGNRFYSVQYQTRFTLNSDLTSRLSLYTTLFVNQGVSSTKTSVLDYKILNAGLSYKVFKKSTTQIKVQAFDIFRQNSSIINEGFDNKLTIGTTNVLRRYFMISLLYLPRKFGKNEQRKN